MGRHLARTVRRERQQTELVAALGAYLAAADLVANVFASTPPPRSLGLLDRVADRIIGARPLHLLAAMAERLAFGDSNSRLLDRFFDASNRVRLLAPIEILGYMNDVDRLFGDWQEETGARQLRRWGELREQLQLVFQRTADAGEPRPYRLNGLAPKVTTDERPQPLSLIYMIVVFASILAYATIRADDHWSAAGASLMALSAVVGTQVIFAVLLPSGRSESSLRTIKLMLQTVQILAMALAALLISNFAPRLAKRLAGIVDKRTRRRTDLWPDHHASRICHARSSCDGLRSESLADGEWQVAHFSREIVGEVPLSPRSSQSRNPAGDLSLSRRRRLRNPGDVLIRSDGLADAPFPGPRSLPQGR